MKKIAVLLLSLVMIIGIATGCTTATSDGGITEPQQTQTNTTQPPSQTTQPDATEAPEIVLYINNGAGTGPGSEAGSTKEAYEMVQNYILEKTGVKVTAILAPQEGSAEKLSMLLAGGDQLDMWWGSWQTYYSSGIIQPINDLLDNAPAVVAAWEEWNAWPGMTDKDGMIWGVPRSTPTTPYQMFVRQDWLEQLDLSQPTTLDELNMVLYAFKKADPYGNGQTIPLITRGMSQLEYCLVGGYVETGASIWVDEDGLVKPLQLADGYADFLAQLNKWYEEGIIHMENFGWDVGTVREHIAKGDVGATATWYSDVTGRANTLKANVPGASFGIYEVGLTGPNGNLIQTYTNASTSGLLMHANSASREACMTFVNWAYEDWYNFAVSGSGIEGVHWKYIDAPDAKANNQIELIFKEGGTTGYFNDFCVSLGLPMEVQNISFDEDGEQNMHNLWLREHLNDYDAALAPVDFGIFFDSNAIEENIPTKGDITRIISVETVKFVTGERPLSEYDDFVQELYSAGLDQWIAEYTKQYNELKG